MEQCLVREKNGEVLRTEPISEIVVVRNENEKSYLVKSAYDGQVYRLYKITQNPKRIIFYNDRPISTCGKNYIPIFNSEVKEVVFETLSNIGKIPLNIKELEGNEMKVERVGSLGTLQNIEVDEKCSIGSYSWRMNVVVERDKTVPIGFIGVNDSYDWGVSVSNSYDLSEGINVMLYLFRKVCNNGLYATSVASKKTFLHISSKGDAEERVAGVLEKVRNGVSNVVNYHDYFFSRLVEMSKLNIGREQATNVLRSINIRKHEAEDLKNEGIEIEFANGLIKGVSFTKEFTEYDFLNHLTAVGRNARTLSRELEIQTGIMEKIVRFRGEL